MAVLGTVFFGRFEADDPVGAFAAVLWCADGLILLTAALAALLPRRAREEPVDEAHPVATWRGDRRLGTHPAGSPRSGTEAR